MTWAVFAGGALMVLVGLLIVSYGLPIVRMEAGWTAVIGGSVAASAGCVVLVLGVFLTRMDQLQASLDRLLPLHAPEDLTSYSGPAPEAAEFVDEPLDLGTPVRPLHPLAPAARGPEPDVVRPEPFLAAAAEPAFELTTPVRSRPEWTDEPATVSEPVLTDGAPALMQAEEEASHPPPIEAPVATFDPLSEAPAPARARPSFLSSLLARRGIGERRPGPAAETFGRPAERPRPEDMPALADLPVDLSTGWDRSTVQGDGRAVGLEIDDFEDAGRVYPPLDAPRPEVPEPPPLATSYAQRAPEPFIAPEPEPVPILEAEEEAPAPAEHPAVLAAPVDPLQPIVVGRYNAGSASYVMFSNGMIQVETEQGTHEFASMQELKVFIERRDAHAS